MNELTDIALPVREFPTRSFHCLQPWLGALVDGTVPVKIRMRCVSARCTNTGSVFLSYIRYSIPPYFLDSPRIYCAANVYSFQRQLTIGPTSATFEFKH